MISYNVRNWPILSFLDPSFTLNVRMVAVFGTFGNEALIVTKDKMVYAVGYNSYGCLGISDNHDTLYPKEVKELCGMGIQTFAYGRRPHVLALTANGQVYSWGCNDWSKLNNDNCYEAYVSTAINSKPILVQTNLSEKFVLDIACGNSHCLALTNEGEVYAWGRNDAGQVGNGNKINQDVPVKVNFALANDRIVRIACGDSSSVAITENGEIYSWGDNGVGQLGVGNYEDRVYPCIVQGLILTKIEKVVCGYKHTMALSSKGILYVWGSNSYGQLGNGIDSNVAIPMKLLGMEKISDIAASPYNNISLAMGECKRVFMWGQCLGQCIKHPVLTYETSLHDACVRYAWPSVMHRPLVLDNTWEGNLIDDLKEAFDDPATSDLTIQVQEKAICVHKSILKIRCHYFRTMFQDHWIENNQNIIKHEQFSYDVYKAFLKYLYTDEIVLPPGNELELLHLADAYSEDQLKRRCIQMIKQEMTIMNVMFLYSTAVKYNEKELEECSFTFALSRMTSVVQTPNFAKLDETTVKNFIIKAAQAGAFKT
ncbi:RCC1 and BTB domain-containing protein 1-like isoform X1 [Colletes latitarsis]|uniref:RCC1 and BTB domain-containing protein 1-like isoform X1 n=1 Tax=Colletes latitarsis TaxID=2605962 RepID=UPI004035B08D